MKSKPPKLSVVIPAYNEAERFKKTLPKIIKFFTSQKFTTEIIVADDGSTDNTAAVVQNHSKKTKSLKLVKLDKNLGKGGALRSGIAASKGDWVLFMDADLSTPMHELNNFWKHTKKFKIIIGSRKMVGANVTKHQSFLRENLGKVFTFLTNTLATKGLSDVTCGFKLFEGKAARKLFKKGVLNDWSFDAEILFLAQKYNYKIKESPVSWENDPRTKVNMLEDGVNALIGLLRIRLNDIAGKY